VIGNNLRLYRVMAAVV